MFCRLKKKPLSSLGGGALSSLFKQFNMACVQNIDIQVQTVYYTINNIGLAEMKKYHKFTIISLFLLRYDEIIT